MARKKCCGLVDETPGCRRFIPDGAAQGEKVSVSLEEFEAIRLKDLAGLSQVGAAAAMKLSRTTFQRILRSARYKVAKALAEGKQIVFEGGHYHMNNRVFECVDCGKRWEEAPCTAGGKHGYEIACPACGSMKKVKVDSDGTRTACGGQGHGHGHGCCGGH